MIAPAVIPHARNNQGFPDLATGEKQATTGELPGVGLAILQAQLDRIEAKVDALTAKPKPHLTRIEFAELAGISRWTVYAYINSGRIRTEKGRIPRTELEKFVS